MICWKSLWNMRSVYKNCSNNILGEIAGVWKNNYRNFVPFSCTIEWTNEALHLLYLLIFFLPSLQWVYHHHSLLLDLALWHPFLVDGFAVQRSLQMGSILVKAVDRHPGPLQEICKRLFDLPIKRDSKTLYKFVKCTFHLYPLWIHHFLGFRPLSPCTISLRRWKEDTVTIYNFNFVWE